MDSSDSGTLCGAQAIAAGIGSGSRIVEPTFGQMKEARGFRRFLLRGLQSVPHEWALVCTAHNLVKLAHRAA